MNNPFAPLYEVCNKGSAKEKLKNIGDFPRLIDIELTNTCNFRCLMCPTGNLSQTRKGGFMSSETFCRIVNQMPEGTGLRFIGWGEPLSHPDIVAFVALAKTRGILTHMNTNGSYLTPMMAQDLSRAGLDSIKFSFQGVDRESYAAMRNTDYFDELMTKIELMMWDGDRPFVSVSTTVTDESDDRIEAFKASIFADEINVGRTIFSFFDSSAARLSDEDKARLEGFAAAEDKSKLRHPDPCPEVYDKLFIRYDGGVSVCCNDFDAKESLGNVMNWPIREIWRAGRMEQYRARLAEGDYTMPLCETCYDYMECTGK